MGGAKAFTNDTMKKVAGIGKIKIRVSGTNLIPIIAALEHYENTLNMGLVKRQGAICSVISRCNKWLNTKEAKLNNATDPDANVKMRAARVRTLMDEAWDELSQSDAGVANAFGAYVTRKNAAPKQTSGMSSGYGQERAAYLKSGKTQSVSASLIDDLLDTGRTRNEFHPASAKINTAREESIAYRNTRKNMLNKAVKQRKLAELTMKDWNKIHNIAASIREPGELETRYMRRPERLNYMLESDDVGGLRYIVGQRSAQTTGTAQWPYAMDEYGNIYTANDEIDESRAGKAMFNHSTFTAGDEVVCAGMLSIAANGKLGHIDNNSGHYKPTLDQLKAVVRILLNEYEVIMKGAVVHYIGADNSRTMWGVGEEGNFLIDQPPLQRTNKPLPQLPNH